MIRFNSPSHSTPLEAIFLGWNRVIGGEALSPAEPGTAIFAVIWELDFAVRGAIFLDNPAISLMIWGGISALRREIRG
jgi:hypothetical protein